MIANSAPTQTQAHIDMELSLIPYQYQGCWGTHLKREKEVEVTTADFLLLFFIPEKKREELTSHEAMSIEVVYISANLKTPYIVEI
ncbi:CLUMA_CG016693, isoform A [Clunio marinus]|uniref:CLUMA_CG016693, isoform A n=1 Tax=Clunio marinus TaxID=568069 RepID=A0A1J1IV22_9DIPT|nr:CLUMA_CG016693, isoform A [Clunio marinus]